MRTERRPSGLTLLEALVVLGLLATILAAASPALLRQLDRYAVVGAREALAGAAARARAVAVAAGGASLVLDVPAGRAWIETTAGDTIGDAVHLNTVYGVQTRVVGSSAQRVALGFDGLGIGRLANRTIRFERGEAAAGLTISAYGRIRRW
jgi:Tfp pilus assembly protein FimT